MIADLTNSVKVMYCSYYIWYLCINVEIKSNL